MQPLPISHQKKLRIVVDEAAQPLVDLFRKATAPTADAEWIFISERHPGIPDGEILSRLLDRNTILITRDRVLHNQACRLGFRSYTTDESGHLRRRELRNIPTPKPLPIRGSDQLKSDYTHPPNAIAHALKAGLSDRDFKRDRTRRRRIRSYFGSESNIASVALTIGSKPARGGLICGFYLGLAGYSEVRGLRASEGYGLISGLGNPAYSLLHALRDVYLLQLENIPTEIYVISSDSLHLAQEQLNQATTDGAQSPAGALRMLLHGLRKVQILPCLKGRFFDAMQAKLDQMARGKSNELVPFEVRHMITALQTAGASAPEPPGDRLPS